jgi:Rrf2 family protein
VANIFSLTEAVSIALHGMVLISKSEKKMNVIQISEKIGASKHHVAKVFQRLVKDNFLGSTRGPSGGFHLKKQPKEITLLDIYQSIEGNIEIATCPTHSDVCPFKSCILGNVANNLTKTFKEYLEKTTLESLQN